MKKFIICCFMGLYVNSAFAQSQPVWTHTFDTGPDSAYLQPVRIFSDRNDDILVLSSYHHYLTGENKIEVNKLNDSGQLIWNCTFDNGGIGWPRGFDMAIDTAGNSYVAGGYFVQPYKCLLMKINSNGTVAWTVDTTSTGMTSNFTQVIMHYNKLYVASTDGIAVFDLNGNEIWSTLIPVSRIAVDGNGQVIVSAVVGSNTIFRYDSLGNLNFSDSTINARKICVDSHNNMLLISDAPVYSVVKYDSSGNFQWQYDSLPPPPGFGDIGIDILTDINDNVWAVGLDDSIFKFDAGGALKWKHPMNGMDQYIDAAKMNYDHLLIAGTTYNTQYDLAVGNFNSMGWQNWSGAYNSNTRQEFSVDVVMNVNGIFVIEDSISYTNVLKFTLPTGSTPINYSLVCVDSVWYDTINPQFIKVRIYNGDIETMNYPSVMILSPIGDTISNRYNLISFFVQFGNTYQTYTDSITTPGITDFSNYTFVISEHSGNTSAIIPFCITLDVDDPSLHEFTLYPNPVTNVIHIISHTNGMLRLYDMAGQMVMTHKFFIGESILDLSNLRSGMYLLQSGDLNQSMHIILKE